MVGDPRTYGWTARVIAAVSVFYFLYLASLHSSIAGMEFCSTLLCLSALYLGISGRTRVAWRPQDKKLILVLAGFAAWVAVSLWLNPLVKPFWFQLGFMRWTAVLVGLMVSLEFVWNSIEFQRYWLPLWAVLICVTGAYAVFECLTGMDFIHSGAVSAQGNGIYRAVGFFSISLTFAYCLGILTFASFLPVMKWNRAAGIAVIGFGSLGVLASLSRGAWLASVACIFTYLIFRKRSLLIPALVVIGGLVALLLQQGGIFARKISEILHFEMDHSSAVRVDLWRAYWKMFLEHPLFGVGIFSGDKYLPEYYLKLGIDQPFTSHAHNNLLNWLAGTGLVGFLFYSIICVYFLTMAWRLRNVTSWGWSLFLAQLFVQLGGLTECNFIDGEVTHCLMLTWAITWVLDRQFTSNQRLVA